MWRRLLQFRLFSLFILVTVVGIGLGVHVRLRQLGRHAQAHRREAQRYRLFALVAGVLASDEWQFDTEEGFDRIAAALDESGLEVSDTRACWKVIDSEMQQITVSAGPPDVGTSGSGPVRKVMARRAEAFHQAADYHSSVANAFESASYHPWYVALPPLYAPSEGIAERVE